MIRLCTGQEARLPRVGQRVNAHPYIGIDSVKGMMPAIVTYVNPVKGWFTVYFEPGYKEAFRFDAPEVEF